MSDTRKQIDIHLEAICTLNSNSGIDDTKAERRTKKRKIAEIYRTIKEIDPVWFKDNLQVSRTVKIKS